MKKKMQSILNASKSKLINVQLDYRTFISLPNIAALKKWLERYPGAKVLH